MEIKNNKMLFNSRDYVTIALLMSNNVNTLLSIYIIISQITNSIRFLVF